MEKRNKIAIVTDSGASLPTNLRTAEYTGNNIVEVPLRIVTSDNVRGAVINEWHDHALSFDEREQFISDLGNTSLKLTTSSPSPNDYAKVYSNIINKGVNEIAVIPISSKLSGSMNSAIIAANDFIDQANIKIIESNTASVGQTLLAYQAQHENNLGNFNNAAELAQRVSELSKRLFAVQAFSNLEHLKRGGRINSATKIVGELLNVIPIIQVTNEGTLSPIDKNRGWIKTRRALVEHTSKAVGDNAIRLALVHFASDQINNFQNDINGKFNIASDENGNKFDLIECEQSNIISVHSGPGVIGVCALQL